MLIEPIFILVCMTFILNQINYIIDFFNDLSLLIPETSQYLFIGVLLVPPILKPIEPGSHLEFLNTMRGLCIFEQAIQSDPAT